MANVKVVVESTIKQPHIQIDISLREAKLLANGHANITEIVNCDIRKAVDYAGNVVAETYASGN